MRWMEGIAYRFIAIKMLLLADLNYLNQPQVLPGPNMSFSYSLLNIYIDDYLTAVKPHLSAWQMDRHELNYVSGTDEKTTRRLISMQAQIMEWPRGNTKLFCVLSLWLPVKNEYHGWAIRCLEATVRTCFQQQFPYWPFHNREPSFARQSDESCPLAQISLWKF